MYHFKGECINKGSKNVSTATDTVPSENHPWERGIVGQTQISVTPDLENAHMKIPEPPAI